MAPLEVNTGYSTSINARAARNRRQREQRHRRQTLTNTKLSVPVQRDFRKLKPSTRRRLEKERARELWVLPGNIDLTTKVESTYPRAALLGLPAELRQMILLQSYDTRQMAEQVLIGTRVWKRLPRTLRKTLFHISLYKKTFLAQEQEIVSKLSNRFVELSQVSKILWKDMRYVGHQWQRQI